MMDLSTIQNMSRKAARKAAKEHKHPLLVEAEDLCNHEVLFEHLRHIPFLGHYLPKGYAKMDDWFVDMSGFGDEDEPALSHRQFINRVKTLGPGYSYNFSEIGQFQGYVVVSRKER